jgi:hypothetical protein
MTAIVQAIARDQVDLVTHTLPSEEFESRNLADSIFKYLSIQPPIPVNIGLHDCYKNMTNILEIDAINKLIVQSVCSTNQENDMQQIETIYDEELKATDLITVDKELRIRSNIYDSLSHLDEFNVLIPNQVELIDYLVEYQDMMELLPFVMGITRKYVGNEPQLCLEVYHEYDFDSQYLVLWVRQDKYDHDIMDKINSIWKEYQDKLVGKSGSILITTDFDTPK